LFINGCIVFTAILFFSWDSEEKLFPAHASYVNGTEIPTQINASRLNKPCWYVCPRRIRQWSAGCTHTGNFIKLCM